LCTKAAKEKKSKRFQDTKNLKQGKIAILNIYSTERLFQEFRLK